ncbi:hypothetical protein B0J14DRAFT_562193 [Halenospora varia]|nr:hypothetical protein B0J14DRAFT_562193 [Halenospora varia]
MYGSKMLYPPVRCEVHGTSYPGNGFHTRDGFNSGNNGFDPAHVPYLDPNLESNPDQDLDQGLGWKQALDRSKSFLTYHEVLRNIENPSNQASKITTRSAPLLTDFRAPRAGGDGWGRTNNSNPVGESQCQCQWVGIYVAKELSRLNLAYLHAVESRTAGSQDVDSDSPEKVDFLIDAWGSSGAVIVAGGFTPESAAEAVKQRRGKNIAVGLGRYFTSNPDLPYRIHEKIPLVEYNRATLYVAQSPVGYIDYPFSPAFKEVTLKA